MKKFSNNLVIQVLVSFLALPLVVAGLIPVLIIVADPFRQPLFLPGIGVPAAGLVITISCVLEFFRQGQGTLAPWAPPKHLVVTGLYRYSRNPMYIGVLLIITGLSLLFTSPILLAYSAAVGTAFHLRIVKYEEPALSAVFGQKWVLYSALVNRWIPKLK